MEDARKLLESLMGPNRNIDRQEFKKKKGQAFKEDNICKHYLVGFCPKHEGLFHSTKRDLGSCTKIHSDAMKAELEAHKDTSKYTNDYENSLKKHLEELVRSADAWVARERGNIMDLNRSLEESGPSDLAKGEIKKLQEQASLLLNEAEDLAERGNMEGSKLKAEMATEVTKRALEWEEKAKAARKDDVCDICGSRMESGDTRVAKFRHSEGKVHLGYVKIREFLHGLRARIREREYAIEKIREERRNRGEPSRTPVRRSRSRSRGGRDRERDRGDRSRTDRRDDGDRSRAGGRGGDDRDADDRRRSERGRDSDRRAGDRDRGDDRGGGGGGSYDEPRGGRDRRGRDREYDDRGSDGRGRGGGGGNDRSRGSGGRRPELLT